MNSWESEGEGGGEETRNEKDENEKNPISGGAIGHSKLSLDIFCHTLIALFRVYYSFDLFFVSTRLFV